METGSHRPFLGSPRIQVVAPRRRPVSGLARVCDTSQSARPATTTMPPSPAAVPSLSNDTASQSSSSTSSSSLDTRWASDIAAHDILEDDGTGALVVPSTSTPHLHQNQTLYPCLFHTLNCHTTFTNSPQWRTHVHSHFRTHAPPPTARCPLCPALRFFDSPARSAWDQLLDHVDSAHYQHGQSLAGSRPDFDLMQYLFRSRIIGVDQFKAVQLAPGLESPAYHRSQEGLRARIGSSDEPFCAPYSRRREERGRGERRGMGVV